MVKNYWCLFSFTSLYNNSNKDIYKNFSAFIVKIGSTQTCYIEFISFLAYKVLKQEDSVCIELTKELRKKGIFDN